MVSFPHSLLRASQFFVFVFLGLVIAEFLFGIMAWVPVRAVGAVLAAVPLAYTGRRNLESLISSLGEWWVDQVLLEEMREMYRTVSWWIQIMEWIRSFWSNIYKSTLIIWGNSGTNCLQGALVSGWWRGYFSHILHKSRTYVIWHLWRDDLQEGTTLSGEKKPWEFQQRFGLQQPQPPSIPGIDSLV